MKTNYKSAMISYTLEILISRLQWYVLEQTAASRCEGFPMLQALTVPIFTLGGTENLHIMKLLSAREYNIQFCRHECFKTN